MLGHLFQTVQPSLAWERWPLGQEGNGGKGCGLWLALWLQQSRGTSLRPSNQVQGEWGTDRERSPPSMGILLASPRLQGWRGVKSEHPSDVPRSHRGPVWPSTGSPQSFGIFRPHLKEAKTGPAGVRRMGLPTSGRHS